MKLLGSVRFAGLVSAITLMNIPALSAQTQKLPLGIYQAGRFTFAIQEGGRYEVRTGGGKVTGVYKVSGEQIEINDEGGDFACPSGTGKYNWKADADKLTFVLVEDSCEGRVAALTTGPLMEDRLTGQWNGTWEQNGGQSGTFRMTIDRNSQETSAGTVSVEMNGTQIYSAPIKQAMLNGNKMSAKWKYNSPDGEADILLEGELQTNSVSGTWSFCPAGESTYTSAGSWKATRK